MHEQCAISYYAASPSFLQSSDIAFRLLKCDSVDIPDYDYLKERDGKPREIAEAVYAARLKMTSYYDKTCRVPIYAISTGNHFYITKIARY